MTAGEQMLAWIEKHAVVELTDWQREILADRVEGVAPPRRIITHPLFPGQVFVASEKLFDPPTVPHIFPPAGAAGWLDEGLARAGMRQLIGQHYADPLLFIRRDFAIPAAVMARARERYRRLKIRSAMSRTKPLPIDGSAYHQRSRRRTGGRR